jgi:transcriptional regulator with XRE-family HTH domain
MTPATLRQLLDDQGVTPKELANRIGVTRATVYNWLGSRAPIKKMAALAIEKVLK